MRGSHGWNEISRERKREIIAAIVDGRSTGGPVHAELDLTDRCNVACYFCNQQDLRTKQQIPIRRTTELIDELAEGGLRSVRLSGGGDPLFHREILDVLDHLAARDVVVDNLTTNGVALTREVGERLVRNRAREVIVSLNTSDRLDYQRMMRVKPALFDKVLENVRTLLALRGDSIYPSVVLQFLIDRENWSRMVEMYELGASLGVDRVSINAVLEIPRERIDEATLLAPSDREQARPLVEEILRRDRDRGLLQLDFAVPGWNEMLASARSATGTVAVNDYPAASSFRDGDGGCFFAWYTAAITGNGDIRPCCLLLNPDYPALGNVMESSFDSHWNGQAFGRMREEMREVLVRRGELFFTPRRFSILRKQCVEPNLCWLKNIYFRGDEQFYRELGVALDEVRSREVRWLGTPKQIARAAEAFLWRRPLVHRLFDSTKSITKPLRIWIKRRLGWNVSGATITE